MQGEGYLGPDQHDAFEGIDDVVQFGGVGFQELTSGRDIEEEVLDQKVASYRTGTGLLTCKTAAGDRKVCAKLLAFHTRLQLDLCNGGDGSQCLAAEPHRMEGKEVVGLADLGSGMPLEREPCIGLRHSLAVINYLDGRAACVGYQHIDVLRFGINRILHQFLDDRGRPLDDLAGCYLVGYAVW